MSKAIVLEDLRKQINVIDEQIISLLEDRLTVSAAVGRIKDELQLPLTDSGRETEILTSLKNMTEQELLKETISKIYPYIFAMSKELRKK